MALSTANSTTKPPAQPVRTLGCCSLLEHLALLSDLEQESLVDRDVANLLDRARRLLTGQTTVPHEVPWWAR